jgi:hypothetical protein
VHPAGCLPLARREVSAARGLEDHLRELCLLLSGTALAAAVALPVSAGRGGLGTGQACPSAACQSAAGGSQRSAASLNALSTGRFAGQRPETARWARRPALPGPQDSLTSRLSRPGRPPKPASCPFRIAGRDGSPLMLLLSERPAATLVPRRYG